MHKALLVLICLSACAKTAEPVKVRCAVKVENLPAIEAVKDLEHIKSSIDVVQRQLDKVEEQIK